MRRQPAIAGLPHGGWIIDRLRSESTRPGAVLAVELREHRVAVEANPPVPITRVSRTSQCALAANEIARQGGATALLAAALSARELHRSSSGVRFQRFATARDSPL